MSFHALVMVAAWFAVTALGAAEIHMRDGTVQRNVTEVQVLDAVILFNVNGKSRSLSKQRIEKILDDSGSIIYQTEILLAQREPGETARFAFFRNDVRVGAGGWDAGEDSRFLLSGDSRIPDGLYRQYYDSGKLHREFTFTAGRLDGPCRVHFESGRIEQEGTFRNNREDGVSRMYYEDGRLKGESVFVNGRRHGETRLYHPGGQLKAIMNFADGKATGIQKTFYESGETESELTFKNGVKAGEFRHYYESGKMRMEGEFVAGKLDGLVTSYFESGRVKKRIQFKMDNPVEERTGGPLPTPAR